MKIGERENPKIAEHQQDPTSTCLCRRVKWYASRYALLIAAVAVTAVFAGVLLYSLSDTGDVNYWTNDPKEINCIYQADQKCPGIFVHAYLRNGWFFRESYLTGDSVSECFDGRDGKCTVIKSPWADCFAPDCGEI